MKACGDLFTEILHNCFNHTLGISRASTIHDSQMTATSQQGDLYQPAYGRLNGDRGGGWCAEEPAGNDDWLQVDLGESFELCGVATQGNRNGNEWTTHFKLSYSPDGINWTTYKDPNGLEAVRCRYFTFFAVFLKLNISFWDFIFLSALSISQVPLQDKKATANDFFINWKGG